MINNVILVGTIINDVKLNVAGEYEVCTIVLRVQRPFRDMETNEYKCDFIPVTFWNVYAKSIADFCNKGDIVGVKARLVRKVNGVTKDNINIYSTEVVGERVAFINLKHTNDQFKDLRDKSNEEEDYGMPTLDELKKMAKSVDVNEYDMNQEIFEENEMIEEEYQENELKEVKGKTSSKGKKNK